MTIQASQSSSPPALLELQVFEDEEEYNEVIDKIVQLARTSSSPENEYQRMAILHFNNNRPVEALQAVQSAEEWAIKNGTAPLSIYASLFYRSIHYLFHGDFSDFEIAKKDLADILSLNTISDLERAHIRKFHALATSKLHAPAISLYTQDLKNLFDRNMDYQHIYVEEAEAALCKEYNRAVHTYNFIFANKNDAIMLKHGCNIAKLAFDKIISGGKCSKLMLENSLFYRANIHFHLKNYLSTFEDLEKLINLNPDHNEAIEFKGTLLADLLKMNTKQKLAWIDSSLLVRKNDPDLLIWKAEAHFQLNQILPGKETAQILLGQIDESHPYYAIVFRMAETPLTNIFA